MLIAMHRLSRRWLVLFGVMLSLLCVWRPAARYLRAARFLQHMGQPATGAAAIGAAPAAPVVTTRDVSIVGEHGPIRARLYFRADQPRGEGIVVAHGVHYQGIDEKRLVPFVRGLAESGLTVLTPELSDLADYRITSTGVGVIQAAVRYLAADREHVLGERVGLLGFSFAGGLSLVAAEDPETAEQLSFVTSVGGHHDLRHVLRFLIHNEIETPSGIVHMQAHEYGLVVLLYGNLEQFVPETDLAPMRAGFKAWLREDRKAARELAKAAHHARSERALGFAGGGQATVPGPALGRAARSTAPTASRTVRRGQARRRAGAGVSAARRTRQRDPAIRNRRRRSRARFGAAHRAGFTFDRARGGEQERRLRRSAGVGLFHGAATLSRASPDPLEAR